MNSDLICANITKHIPLTNSEKNYFCSLLHSAVFDKNDFLLRSSKSCNYIYFVNSGILRAFFVNDKGKESTIIFAVKDWWITDMYCFLNELPAIVNIQAVEASGVLILSKTKLDELYNEIPAFNKFFRVIMQNAYCREQLRIIQNLSLSSKVRYNNFLKQYPQIANNVPLKQIASYLGITPEFLSAIRAEKD